MNQLQKMKQQAEHNAAQVADQDVRECLELTADREEKLRAYLLDLEKLTPSTRKLIDNTARSYPQSANFPGYLRDLLGHLHGDFLRPCRDQLDNLPAKIQGWLEKRRNLSPADFRTSTPALIAFEENRRADGMWSDVKRLGELPEVLKRLTDEIDEFVARNVGREFPPEQKGGVLRVVEPNEPRTIGGNFDARAT